LTPKIPDLTDDANELGSLMLPRFLNNDEVVNAKSSGGFRLTIVDRVYVQDTEIQTHCFCLFTYFCNSIKNRTII